MNKATKTKEQTTNKKKAGRKPKEINQKSFETLCSLHCTSEEIAAVFQISRNLLYQWCKRTYGEYFDEVYKWFSSNGNVSLRRNLYIMSAKNPAVAIFMAKNYLGMSELARSTQIPQEVIESHNSSIQTLNAMLTHPAETRNIEDFENDDDNDEEYADGDYQ